MRISLVVAALAAGSLAGQPAAAGGGIGGAIAGAVVRAVVDNAVDRMLTPDLSHPPVMAGPAFVRPYEPAPRHYRYGAQRYPVGANLVAAPPTITLYREPYIGRGLIYNTPPTLDRPGPGPILSARY